jgi:hypothetical protein
VLQRDEPELYTNPGSSIKAIIVSDLPQIELG